MDCKIFDLDLFQALALIFGYPLAYPGVVSRWGETRGGTMPRKDRSASRIAQAAPQDQGAVPLAQDQDQDQGKARIDLPQEMPPSVGAPSSEAKSAPAPKPAPQPEPEEEEEENEEEDDEGLEDADGEEADGEETDGEEADGEDPGDELGLELPTNPPGDQETPGEKAPPHRKRGRPRNPKNNEEIEFLKITETARRIGARIDQIKVWAEAGQIPGVRYQNNGLFIPKPWADAVIDGSIMAPDGIPRKKQAQKRGEEEPLKANAAAMGRNQEVLNKLQGLYGTDADLKVELSRRGPAGYAYLQDMPHPPSKAELQGMFPDGGDFQLRIFKSGKVVDEVSGVIVDSIDGTPYNPSQAYAPTPGGFRRPVPGRMGFQGRPGFDPDGPPGLRSGGGDDGVGYLARKAADFAFDSMGKKNGGNGSDTAAVLQTVSEQTRHQVDSLAQSLEAERDRNRQREAEQARIRKEERDEAEARRREEKEELEEQIAAQREEYENAKKLELDKLRMEHEQTATREREYLDRMRTAEQERTKSMIEAQNSFFTQMRELDKKRDDITRESHKESLAMQEKLMLAQRESIEEQRRANDRMFEVQMGHLADMKNSGEPLALIASALGKGLEKIGPMIQSRMAGVNPGFAGATVQPRAAITAEGSQGTGGDTMNLMQKIKTQPMFAEELEAIADKVKKKVHPAFTVNKLLGMMQYDPSISIILDYVVSADVRDVAKGVRLSSDATQTLNSKEAAEWWTLFQSLLQKTMVASIEQAPPPPPEAPPAPPANPGQGPSLNQGL